jgi:hypothetical protein
MSDTQDQSSNEKKRNRNVISTASLGDKPSTKKTNLNKSTTMNDDIMVLSSDEDEVFTDDAVSNKSNKDVPEKITNSRWVTFL